MNHEPHTTTRKTLTKEEEQKQKQRMKTYVLVHGGCHGAWCWYKVKPVLEHSGHRVIVVELTASGVNMSRVEEIQSLEDYAKPLLEVLESFRSEEKVILVAHSLGGFSVALAAEMFPSKISVAVFVTSFMPDMTNPISYYFEQFLDGLTEEDRLDFELGTYGTPDRPLTTILLGSKYLMENMYQLSPVEDFELAKTLVRVVPAVTRNLTGARSLTKEGYGSVSRVYIVCKADKAMTEDLQRWIIKNNPVKEVMEINDADHMPMFSKPLELCDRLLKIADKYA